MRYRQRNRLFIPAALIVLWLVYVLAIRNTFNLRSECRLLSSKADSAAVSGDALALLQQQQAQFAALTAADSSSGLHESLLGTITGFCDDHHITIRNFPSAQIMKAGNGWNVETHQVTAEGNFHDLLQLLHLLEHQNKKGKVVAASFLSARDNRTQSTALQLTLYIQNILKS